MVSDEIYTLNTAELTEIDNKWGDNPPAPEEFLPDEVMPLETTFGLRDPLTQSPVPSIVMNDQTSYREMYEAQFAVFIFPLRNLQFNTCVG
jgi:hypothetical protein